jgi:hypothetical protein
VYLQAPNTAKVTDRGKGKDFSYATCSMQVWRLNMVRKPPSHKDRKMHIYVSLILIATPSFLGCSMDMAGLKLLSSQRGILSEN